MKSAQKELQKIIDLHITNIKHDVTMPYSSSFIGYKWHFKTGEFDTNNIVILAKAGFIIGNHLIIAHLHQSPSDSVYIESVNLETLQTCLLHYSDKKNYKQALKEMKESKLSAPELMQSFYNGSGSGVFYEGRLNTVESFIAAGYQVTM